MEQTSLKLQTLEDQPKQGSPEAHEEGQEPNQNSGEGS
jgi:hypothetical protein